MKILFRVDGNSIIGWGHVMRSMSIATAAKKTGADAFFVCSDTEMQDILSEYGFRMEALYTDYRELDSETDLITKIIKEEQPELMIIDSYFVTREYLELCSRLTKTMYVDDLFSFPYPVDYLLNYNIYASKEKYEALYGAVETMPRLLLGPSYSPLREAFKSGRSEFREKVRNVYVSVGGSDVHGLLLKLVSEFLKDDRYKDLSFHLIMGSHEPDRGEIYAVADRDNRFRVYEKEKNVAAIMQICDLAISAAGSTLYELCACNVPTVAFVLADNQIEGAETFEKNEMMLCAGDIRKQGYDVGSTLERLNRLLSDIGLRKSLYDHVKAKIDGRGSDRIIEALK